jgi:2-polyprenyl-6-methoxyphenol hydroxylase-like FAD-dependent oxidoreductase
MNGCDCSHFRLQILESASELKEVGAAITPGPGALGILRRFGVHLEKEGGCVNDHVQIWGGNGKAFAKHPYNPSGAPEGNVVSPPVFSVDT